MSEAIETTKLWPVLALLPCEACDGAGCDACDGKGETLNSVDLRELLQVSGIWDELVSEAAYRSQFVKPVYVG